VPPIAEGQEPSCPPAAGLDLVGDEHDAVLPAELLEPGEEVRGRDDEAPLSLDRLDDHGGHVLRIDHRDEGSLDRL
jgi:hypothetical protein